MNDQSPIDTRMHRLKLSAADFELLDRNGAFQAYRKTELIEGEIYFVNAQHRPHGMVKMRLYDQLRDTLRSINSSLTPVCEFSLALSDMDRPEPDIMLTSEPDGDGSVPLHSVALIIEVSDTTFSEDMGRKQRIYALGAVPEYWVADVGARVIHQLWSPAGTSYAERREIAFGAPITAATVDRLTIDTSGL